MTATAYPGPLSVEGAKPALVGPTPNLGGPPALVNENGEFSPSLFWMGMGVRDPRYLQRIGAGALVSGAYPNQDCGWYFAGAGMLVADQVPATAAANNVAASQATTVGGAMTLAAASVGVTVLAAALTILPTGKVVPAGCLVLDGTPTYTGSGNGAFAFMTPTNSLSRALVVGGAGSDVTISGYDIYGNPMSERIAAANGKKAFKFIQSISGNAVAAAVTVGTLDIFGLPVLANQANRLRMSWNGTVISTTTGFVAADTTSPATTTTGDVRGTYAAPDAADAVKRLTIYQALEFGVIASTVATAVQNLVGVAQV